MSGHSKWSTIKRQKGVADAKRSQIFTKLANAITVAARQGADPEMNFKLRLAIERARQASMPKDNIERAIKRGTGTAEGLNLEEITYEGYGPGGVAFLIKTLTDNRNRTTANLRHILNQHGGTLADTGSVAWLFANQAVLIIDQPANRPEAELLLIEAGASDLKDETEQLVVIAEANQLENIKRTAEQAQLKITYSAVEPVAKTLVTVDDELNQKLDSLREDLQNEDDVTDTYDNAN